LNAPLIRIPRTIAANRIGGGKVCGRVCRQGVMSIVQRGPAQPRSWHHLTHVINDAIALNRFVIHAQQS
jgi:hypothetical protein